MRTSFSSRSGYSAAFSPSIAQFSGQRKPKQQESGDVFFAAGKRHRRSANGQGSRSWMKTALWGLLLLNGAAVAHPSANRGGSDLSTQDATQILKCPPFIPTNHSLFTPEVYPDAPPMPSTPTPGKAQSETDITAQLSKSFALRFDEDQKAAQEAAKLFDDPQLKALVPNPSLRGALVFLQGTPAESAIEVVKNGTYASVDFADFGKKNIVAAIEPAPNGTGKPKLLFNDRYQHEDFRQFAPLWVHETKHQDKADSAREERISRAMATLIYGLAIAEDPTLAQSGTELSRKQNTEFKARLDSRDADGNLRLFTSQGNVYPGCAPGKELSNYGAAFTQIGPDTTNGTIQDSSPGNDALRQDLERITGLSLDHADFDALTEQNLDTHQIALSPEQLVSAGANALQLNTTCKQAPFSYPPDTSGASRTIQAPGAFRALAYLGKRLMEVTFGKPA